MRGQGIDISSVYVEEYNGTEYVYANVLKEGSSVEQIISRDMSKIIKSINFPKSMRWGGKNIRFARPIRWLVSLLDDEIVPFNLEGIEASNITKGHRFLGSSRIVINHVNEYIESLRQNF